MLMRLRIGPSFDLAYPRLDTGTSSGPSPLVGSEEARSLTITLASVRRSNCTCSFPACSFHKDSLLGGRARRCSASKLTSPISPYSLVCGSCFHPLQRQLLHRCAQMRRTIQASS